MDWVTPKGYSKEQVNRAGDILVSEKSSEEDKNKAIEILENWRAVHSYPMHVFQMRLKLKSRAIDRNAIAVQRLKRVPAIIAKLKRSYDGRSPTMKLSQIQDLGGCRAVLSNVSMAKRLYMDYFMRGNLRHKRTSVKDYVSTPKKEGYRSLHLIYKYYSDKEGKKEYNGLLVEIQIRSRLQHIWATAVETVDFFTRQSIKSNEGREEWMEFFRLVSSAFAKMEKCPLVPNTPADERELFLRIKHIETKLNVIKIMKGWAKALQVFNEAGKKISKRYQYFLLELDILREKLIISTYTKNQEQEAIQRYVDIEKKNKGEKEFDVVLVGAENINDLRKAYSNYFVDSSEFIAHILKIIRKY